MHSAPVFLRKKGSDAPAGILHLCLEKTGLMSNVELDVKAVMEDIKQLPGVGARNTTIAAFTNNISQLGEEDDLYKSVGALFSKLDVFVGFIDDISKVSFTPMYLFAILSRCPRFTPTWPSLGK